jgi:hypothetical protein
MTRRRSALLIALATVALLVAACGGTAPGPTLTDPTAIITAAVNSTAVAKSVHLDATLDGTATVNLGGGGGAGAPIDVSGSTASADIDLVKPAAHATFAVKAGVQVGGEAILVDGTTYLKTTLTGPLYMASPAGSLPIDLSQLPRAINTVGDLLTKQGVTLVKGEDVACGSQQCYTVSADLTADELGTSALGSAGGLPIDLTGASLKLTVMVETSLPNHLAGVTAVLSMPDGTKLTAVLTASKWDQPVTVTAPPADQVKPAS